MLARGLTRGHDVLAVTGGILRFIEPLEVNIGPPEGEQKASDRIKVLLVTVPKHHLDHLMIDSNQLLNADLITEGFIFPAIPVESPNISIKHRRKHRIDLLGLPKRLCDFCDV